MRACVSVCIEQGDKITFRQTVTTTHIVAVRVLPAIVRLFALFIPEVLFV